MLTLQVVGFNQDNGEMALLLSKDSSSVSKQPTQPSQGNIFFNSVRR